MWPWWWALAFLDSGRVSDEFEPSLRRKIRMDLLILLAVGLTLAALGVALVLALSLLLVGLVVLLIGASLAMLAATVWFSVGRIEGP